MTPEEKRRALKIMQLEALRSELGFPAEPGGSSTDSAAVDDFRNKGRAAVTGAANGMSFGFGDNIAATIGGVDSLVRGNGFSRGYDNTLDVVREGMASDKAANPKEYGAGNIIGAAIPAIAAAPIATGPTMLSTAGRGMGLGMLEGGLQGAGNADGQNMMENTAWGAGLGAVAGVVSPVAVGALGRAKDSIAGMLGIGNVGKANKAIGTTIKQSGKTEADITARLAQARADGIPEFRLMDSLGVAGQRQASGVARSGGDAATEISEFLEKRQLGQGERVGAYVEDGFGVKGTTAEQTRDSLNQTRKATNQTNYTAARQDAGPVNLNDAIGKIDALTGRNPLIGDSSLTKSEIGNRLAGLRSKLGNDESQLIDFDQVLNVKEDLGKVIGRIKKSGDEVPFELAQVYGALDEALEASSDGYRAANTAALEGRKVVGAVDKGATMASRGRAADNVPAFGAMSPPEQSAGRIGYGDNLLNKLEAVTSPTSNRAKPLQSFKREAEADAMTLDADLYRRRLAAENDMWGTQNRALGGSRTADNEADKSALEALAGGAGQAIKEVANFKAGDAAARLFGAIGGIGKGQNEETRRLIVEMLMRGDAGTALAPMMKKIGQSETGRRILEAMVRQPTREALPYGPQ